MSAQYPTVSVVLSVYEQPQFLPLVLASLAYQDYAETWELLICDDGSKSDMLAPIKALSRNTACEVRYVWQKDRGFRLARSRNNALHCAQGRIVVFLDGDVVVKPDFLRRHADAHQDGLQLVCGSRSYIFMKAHPQLDLRSLLKPEHIDEIDRYACLPTTPFQRARFRGSNPWYSICGCNFSVSRTPAVSFDEAFVGWGLEDCEFALRLTTRNGFSLQCRTENMVYHLEETPPAMFHPCRPKSHEEISLYLQNVQRLTDLYPEQDFQAVRQTMLGFEYDDTAKTWSSVRGASSKAESRQPIAQKSTAAKILVPPAIVGHRTTAIKERL